jgi:ornithine cyclodeaminase/alanine dehydrogenase-like protein (mu-crystallin family)
VSPHRPVWIDEPGLPVLAAVAALRTALADPAAIAAVPPRQLVDLSAGQLLLMPAELPAAPGEAAFAGVKLVTVAPANAALGRPRIGGVYVLFDAATLVPLALFEAAALTALRTSALSALAVDLLARPDADRLLVFGAGPQAQAHVEAISAVRALRSVHIVARTADSAERVAVRARAMGLAGTAAGVEQPWLEFRLPEADIVACCTTARVPLFDSAALAAEATVVAVGSHEPDARELDADLIRRATVVVESRASAATAGDVVLAGGLPLVDGTLAELVAGTVAVRPGQARVFKSVGESWEDLVVAGAAWRARPGVG